MSKSESLQKRGNQLNDVEHLLAKWISHLYLSSIQKFDYYALQQLKERLIFQAMLKTYVLMYSCARLSSILQEETVLMNLMPLCWSSDDRHSGMHRRVQQNYFVMAIHLSLQAVDLSASKGRLAQVLSRHQKQLSWWEEKTKRERKQTEAKQDQDQYYAVCKWGCEQK